MAHPGIDHVSFTGSTATGKKVMAAASESLKKVFLELGGKSAAILLGDLALVASEREFARAVADLTSQGDGQATMAAASAPARSVPALVHRVW